MPNSSTRSRDLGLMWVSGEVSWLRSHMKADMPRLTDSVVWILVLSRDITWIEASEAGTKHPICAR